MRSFIKIGPDCTSNEIVRKIEHTKEILLCVRLLSLMQSAAFSSSSSYVIPPYLGIFLRSAFLFEEFGVNQISTSFSTPSKYWRLLIFSFSAIFKVNFVFDIVVFITISSDVFMSLKLNLKIETYFSVANSFVD